MTGSNYKEAFLAEAREQLDSLNASLLNLEKEPGNQDYVNQVFRACHTVKGSSAMMGYNTFSELSHRMENLLSKIREHKLKINSEIIDTLFRGVDILEEGLENISHKDIDAIDISDIGSHLSEFESTESEDEKEGILIQELFTPHGDEEAEIGRKRQEGYNVFRVIVVFNKKSPLKGAKAQILIRKADEFFNSVICSNPSLDVIKSGNVDDAFELVVSTKFPKEHIFKILNTVSETVPYVLELDEAYTGGELQRSEMQKKDPTKFLGKPIQSIKVDVKKLDSLVNLVGELLISNMRLKQIGKDLSHPQLNEIIGNIDILTANIQDHVMQERMVPVGQVFNRFPRLVRDLAVNEKKKVNLVIRGEEIELDRTVLDEIGEPLIHALRNSVDHGIESPEERIKAQKHEEGLISLTARREKNIAIIEIKDDGKGIRLENVIEKALKIGMITHKEVDDMNDQQKLNLIFKPGLSTKEVVNEISGRGVGMDVVLSKIKKIGGNVRISTKEGKGTTLELRLPLTLAIITSLIVEVDSEKYAIPLSHVVSTIEITSEDIKTIQGNELFILRDEDIPVIRLHDHFRLKRPQSTVHNVVVTERADRKVGLVVDKVISQQPILIKNLHDLIRGVKGIAGASILGDGRVCLILDVDNIF